MPRMMMRHDRNGREYEGVADVGPQAVKDRHIAVQAEALLETGEITFDKAADNHHDLRHNADQGVTSGTGRVTRKRLPP